MTLLRNTSQEETGNNAPQCSSYTSTPMPWPLPDVPLAESSHPLRLSGLTKSPERMTAQQALEGAYHANEDHDKAPRPRKSSKLKLFANSLPLLRRQGTGDTNVSTGNVSDTLSTAVSATAAPGNGTERNSASDGVNEDAVIAYLAKNARE